MIRRPPRSPLFPTAPLSRSVAHRRRGDGGHRARDPAPPRARLSRDGVPPARRRPLRLAARRRGAPVERSEEHTSELQLRQYLVCRLLLEKKKRKYSSFSSHI